MVVYTDQDVIIYAPYKLQLKNTDGWWVDLECLQNGSGAGLLQVDHGIKCLKDVSAYGGALMTASNPDMYSGTGGGCVQIGHGFQRSESYNPPADPPRINLTDSGYNTLYITAGSSLPPNTIDSVLADIKLRNLKVGGSIQSYSTGAWLFSYYGGGDGGANGGIYLDAYGKIHFNGGTDAYYWQIFKSDGTEVFAVPNKTGATAAIYINCNINPHVTNAFGIGSGSEYWAGVCSNRLYAKDGTVHSFDAMDDLGLVKNYKLKTDVAGRETIDLASSLPHVMADDDDKKDEFYDVSKLHGFTLGCLKALALNKDKQEMEIQMLEQRVEALETHLKQKLSAA